MEWIIESYDRRTDRDGQSRFTTESAFISAAEDLLRNVWKGFEFRNPSRWRNRSRRTGAAGFNRRDRGRALRATTGPYRKPLNKTRSAQMLGVVPWDPYRNRRHGAEP